MHWSKSDDRWAFLAPWWRVLKRFDLDTGYKRCFPHAFASYKTLYVSLSKDQKWETLTEAVELIAMVAVAEGDAAAQGVARTERPFFEGVTAQLNTLIARDFRPTSLSQPIRLGLKLDKHAFTEHFGEIFPRVAECLFSPFQLFKRSKAYQEARQQILQLIRSPGLRRQCEQLTIPVVVVINVERGLQHLVSQLDILGTIYTSQQHKITSKFALEGIKCCGDLSKADDPKRDLEQLCGVLAHPVVPIVALYIEHYTLGRIVREWLRGMETHEAKLSRRKLRMHVRHVYEEDLVAIFSKLAAGAILEEFTHALEGANDLGRYHYKRDSRRRLLQWMAFAFFSPYSRATVKLLNLVDENFTIRDAMVIQEVLEARNPFQILLGSTETDCLVANLLEDVHLLDHGAHLAKGTVVWVLHNDQTSDVIDALVPGHGPCVFPRSSLSTPLLSQAKSHSLRLKLRANDEFSGRNDGQLALAQVLGTHLNGLNIEGITPGTGDQELQSLLQACPHLDFLELQINDGFPGCAILPELYEKGLCNMSVLKLVVMNESELTVVLKALTDPTSRIAKRVRELSVAEWSMATTKATIAVLRTMLEENRTLEAVIFRCFKVEIIEPIIKSAPAVYVAMPQTPTLDVKLTLIRAVYSRGDASSSITRALARMDKTILASIFAFAATPMRRVLGISDRILVS